MWLRGGGQNGSAVELTTCGSSVGNVNVNFGDTANNTICGKVKELGDNQDQLSETTGSVTVLFKNMGKQGSVNWNSQGQSSGKSQCVQNAKGGLTITSSGNTNEYLGYCDTSTPTKDSKEISFLDIKKSNETVGEIEVCGKNCWSDSKTSDLHQLQQKSENQGQKVEFYANKNS